MEISGSFESLSDLLLGLGQEKAGLHPHLGFFQRHLALEKRTTMCGMLIAPNKVLRTHITHYTEVFININTAQCRIRKKLHLYKSRYRWEIWE